MVVVFSYNLLHSSDYIHPTSRVLSAAGPEKPKTKQVKLSLVLLVCATLSLAVAACTNAAGLGGASSGWSPVAAIAIPEDTGSRINEGRNIEPQDNTFTVTHVAEFGVGQVIRIGDERLQIISIREQDLVVTRGVGDTRPQTHADQATIYKIGKQFVVFVATKQGEIKALNDDGLEAPVVDWTCRPGEC